MLSRRGLGHGADEWAGRASRPGAPQRGIPTSTGSHRLPTARSTTHHRELPMTNEEKQRLLQGKLAEMTQLAQAVCELGLELGLDYVPFLGNQIRFAIDGEPAHDRSPF